MTKAAHGSDVSDRIVHFFRSNPHRAWAPKHLADHIGAPGSTIRTALGRLIQSRDGTPAPLLRVEPGIYRLARSLPEMMVREEPSFGLHAIGITFTTRSVRGWAPPPAPNANAGNFGLLRPQDGWSKQPETGQWRLERTWSGRTMRLQVSPSSGHVGVTLKATNPADNLDRDLFGEFVGFLHGYMIAQGIPWSNDTAYLERMEFNWDFRHFRLVGLSGISLKLWRNSWAQIYQKAEDVLRVEVRYEAMGDDSVSLWEAVDIVRTLQNKVPARRGRDL